MLKSARDQAVGASLAAARESRPSLFVQKSAVKHLCAPSRDGPENLASAVECC
jgi:hypothetical protein